MINECSPINNIFSPLRSLGRDRSCEWNGEGGARTTNIEQISCFFASTLGFGKEKDANGERRRKEKDKKKLRIRLEIGWDGRVGGRRNESKV
jgi:hypothetical protein